MHLYVYNSQVSPYRFGRAVLQIRNIPSDAFLLHSPSRAAASDDGEADYEVSVTNRVKAARYEQSRQECPVPLAT